MKYRFQLWPKTFLQYAFKFEAIVIFILSIMVALIVLISLLRIAMEFYSIFFQDMTSLHQLAFEDYQVLFGRILTLLISLEFLHSILKVVKVEDIKTLTLDVVLIAALAIARKLIVYDYNNIEPVKAITLGGLLISIGLFYFLAKYQKSVTSAKEHQ